MRTNPPRPLTDDELTTLHDYLIGETMDAEVAALTLFGFQPPDLEGQFDDMQFSKCPLCGCWCGEEGCFQPDCMEDDEDDEDDEIDLEEGDDVELEFDEND